MKSDVLYEIKALQNDLMRKTFSNKDFNKLKPKQPLSHVQMHIIDHLLKRIDNDVYQKDLEVVLNIRKSTISGILDTMEKNKLIQRIDSPSDQRAKKIILTEEIIKHHKEISAYFKSMSKKLVKNIPKEKLGIFFEVIGLLRENINKN